MTANEYQKLAMRTLNPALDKRDVLINGVMGLCGEAGEAIDIVKSIWRRAIRLTARRSSRSLATWRGIWPRRRMRWTCRLRMCLKGISTSSARAIPGALRRNARLRGRNEGETRRQMRLAAC